MLRPKHKQSPIIIPTEYNMGLRISHVYTRLYNIIIIRSGQQYNNNESVTLFIKLYFYLAVGGGERRWKIRLI